MRRLRSVVQKLKKRTNRVGRRDGISMAIVICIGALLLAFSLAMAYTGSLMMATANTRLEKERAYQLAKSFAEVLDEQLCGENTSDFQEFAKKFIGSSVYRDYNEDKVNETVYSYEMNTSSSDTSEDSLKNYGSVTVKLYKELVDENTETVLTKASNQSGDISTSYAQTIKDIENTYWNRYDLTVVVVVTYGDSEYSYKTEYTCRECMRLQLTYTDSNGKSQNLYYNENDYIYKDQTYTQLYNESYNIYYTRRTDSEGIISRTFTPIIMEKGADTTTNNGTGG